MRILLIDIDSKIPNLALMKISAYYKMFGEEVGFNTVNPDKVFISCIFEKNKQQVEGIKQYYPNAEITLGGSGINNKTLPSDSEYIKPDYDLYPSTYSQGYTTRGCIRNCPWCIVRNKEGDFRRHQHISKFHDDQFDTVMLMDNNILADKEWFFQTTDYILDNNLKLIEHGMDIRLVDKEVAQRLSELKFAKGYMKFAFDQLSDEKRVIDGLKLLKEAGIKIRQNVQFYVLVGYNTTHEEDLYRCNLLKKHGTSSFVMKYHNNDNFLNKLARWSNRKHLFWSCEFTEFYKGVI